MLFTTGYFQRERTDFFLLSVKKPNHNCYIIILVLFQNKDRVLSNVCLNVGSCCCFNSNNLLIKVLEIEHSIQNIEWPCRVVAIGKGGPQNFYQK